MVVLAAVALVGGYTITQLYRDTHWPRPVHVASGQAPRVIERWLDNLRRVVR